MRAFIFLSLMISFHSYSAPSDWYSDLSSTCSSYPPLTSALETYFKKKLNLTLKTNDKLGLIIIVPPTLINSLIEKKTLIYEDVKLDEEKSKNLIKVLSSASEEKIPVLFKSFVSNLPLFNIPKLFDNPLSSWLFDKYLEQLDFFSESLKTVRLFVANGGDILRRIDIYEQNGGRYALITVIYTVNVGLESRSFFLSSCIYPISTEVKEFNTSSSLNNKKLVEISPGIWRRWDMDIQIYQGEKLKYLYQDKDNYYFSEDEIERDAVVGTKIHKISFVGGGWAFKPSDSNEFRKIYLEIKAEP